MRKYWYLDAQFTNLLHLADDITLPVAELQRRFIDFFTVLRLTPGETFSALFMGSVAIVTSYFLFVNVERLLAFLGQK